MIRTIRQLLARVTVRHLVYLLVHVVLALLGFLLFAWYPTDTFLSGIAGSLVAAGFAGWVLYIHGMVAESEARDLKTLTELGLTRAFSKRSIAISEEYKRRLSGAGQSIDIIGFGLRSLREDLSSDFPNWSRRGAKVRILLLDPDFPVAGNHSLSTLRDIEEGQPTGTIASEVREFVVRVREVVGKDKRFQVRLVRALPTLNYFRSSGSAGMTPPTHSAQT